MSTPARHAAAVLLVLLSAAWLLPSAQNISLFRTSCTNYKFHADVTQKKGGKTDCPMIPEKIRIPINDDCKAASRTCFLVRKPITDGVDGKFKFSYPMISPQSGNFSICESLESLSGAVKNMVTLVFPVPDKCPIPKGKICSNPADFSPFARQMKLATQPATAYIEIKFPKGETCGYDVSFKLTAPLISK